MAVMKGLRLLASSATATKRKNHNVARAIEWLERITAYDNEEPIPRRAKLDGNDPAECVGDT
jgi:hypothetical protein